MLMTVNHHWAAIAIFGLTCLGSVFPLTGSAATIPLVAREFRGVWVATVKNMDWPSQVGLTSAQQQAELIAILDRAAQLRLNAVIFQVRPQCDALYASKFEPWSEFLSGRMGVAPWPAYDPLAFAVEEAHRRGLELHAWFNPYRARHTEATSPLAPNHIARTHPELVRTYGTQLWLDPGEKAVQEHSLAVILDVVRRYDVDGVHLDDYFYPYPERDKQGHAVDFPDEPSWQRYVKGGGRLARDDWRRENVNGFIQRLYTSVKSAKRRVKFGISPFGIWRPGFPESIKGLDTYATLFADARLWLVNGWLDYCAPQLYWPMDQQAQSYSVLLKWWQEQNTRSRHLWPGNFANKVADGAWSADEIAQQILIARTARARGNILFSARSLTRPTSCLADLLARTVYAEPALVPASPWLDKSTPAQPRVEARRTADGALDLSWKSGRSERVWLWVLQARIAGRWSAEILPGGQQSAVLRGVEQAALSAVDRCGNQSEAVVILPRN